MDHHADITAIAAFETAVQDHLATTSARISRFEFEGRVFWVKRRETLRLRMRLQKGDPARAFHREKAALETLHAAGVSVPAILAEGPDYFVTGDSGPTLRELLVNQTGSKTDRRAIFEQAAQDLAAWHTRGLSHGRPSIKDICWRDGKITFLDFERYAEKRNNPPGHAKDLIMFVFSIYAFAGGPSPEASAAIAAYKAHDSAAIWPRAERWCRTYRWLNWITRPIQNRKSNKSSEFKVIPDVLRAFNAL